MSNSMHCIFYCGERQPSELLYWEMAFAGTIGLIVCLAFSSVGEPSELLYWEMAFAGTSIGRTATGQLENSNAQRRRRILTRFQFHNLRKIATAVHSAAATDVSAHQILSTEPIFFTAPKLKIEKKILKEIIWFRFYEQMYSGYSC